MTQSPGERTAAALSGPGDAPPPDVVVVPDADRLARSIASALVARLAAAQAVHGTASVVLTGGGIGTAVLEHVASLAAEPEHAVVDWTGVDVWWGDERFVPVDDPERNELGAQRALLDRVVVDPERVHPMPSSDAGFDEPEEAASWYADQLRAAAGGEAALPRFDVLLLGVGPEGHVASIFPDSAAVDDDRPVTAVRDCPKPPPTRISLTFPTICSAEEVWLMATGEGKATAVADALAGAPRRRLPASGARGTRATRWLLDAAAASRLPAAPAPDVD